MAVSAPLIVKTTTGSGTQDLVHTGANTTIVTALSIKNQSLTNAAKVEVWLVPNTKSLGNNYKILNDADLPIDDTIALDSVIKQNLSAGDKIYVETDIASCNVFFSYVELS